MGAERDARGRFVTGNKAANGNKGGPGRPKKKREERYSEILLTTCTFADWQRIVETAVKQAKRGNPQARQWLSDHLVGKPETTVKLGNEGGEPLTFEVIYTNPPPPIRDDES